MATASTKQRQARENNSVQKHARLRTAGVASAAIGALLAFINFFTGIVYGLGGNASAAYTAMALHYLGIVMFFAGIIVAVANSIAIHSNNKKRPSKKPAPTGTWSSMNPSKRLSRLYLGIALTLIIGVIAAVVSWFIWAFSE